MRILDRYVVRQLIPVWVWCIIVFLFLSCLIDLVEHLDEILRYHIRGRVVVQYDSLDQLDGILAKLR